MPREPEDVRSLGQEVPIYESPLCKKLIGSGGSRAFIRLMGHLDETRLLDRNYRRQCLPHWLAFTLGFSSVVASRIRQHIRASCNISLPTFPISAWEHRRAIGSGINLPSATSGSHASHQVKGTSKAAIGRLPRLRAHGRVPSQRNDVPDAIRLVRPWYRCVIPSIRRRGEGETI